METKLYTAEETRTLDTAAMEAGIPGMVLMERAGEAVVREIRERWAGWRRFHIGVLAGGGNNGGDGYVVARRLQEAGVRAAVVAASDPRGLKGDAAEACARWQRLGGAWTGPEASLEDFDLLVDALLGTGLGRDVRSPYRGLIERISELSVPIVAVDVPSGLSADTGRILGAAPAADLTVTFVGLKRGLFTGDGPDCAGEVAFEGLGIPEEVRERVPAGGRLIDPVDLGLEARRGNTHKGDFGRVGVIGGAPGMAGAAALAARAALRGGAGWVICCAAASERGVVASLQPEALTAEWGPGGRIPREVMDSAEVLAVGPGLGCSTEAREVVAAALEWTGPLVLDADGLGWVAEERELADRLSGRQGATVLTPHPGEAARLLGISPGEVQAERFAAATRIAEVFQATCCLKGAGTVIAHAKGGYAVNTSGNPGLAQSGQGDILTGLVAARLAQEADPARAVERAVWAHGAAGDGLSDRLGPFGFTASDCADELPAVWTRLLRSRAYTNHKWE